MPKNEIFDTMERGYSDTSLHARSRDKERPLSRPSASAAADVEYKSRGPRPLNLDALGRSIAARGMRALRRGNLPFLIVFMTALFIFFGALAGIGYVDPEAQAPTAESAFVMGGPVGDVVEGRRLREAAMAAQAEQRALEQQWQRKQRPNAGAWMNKQRNDGAVRAGQMPEEDYDNIPDGPIVADEANTEPEPAPAVEEEPEPIVADEEPLQEDELELKVHHNHEHDEE